MTKSMLATLLIATAVFGPAYGAALAGNDPVADSVFPNFWGEDPTSERSNPTGAHQGDEGASIDIYVTQPRGAGTYLFPPNPNL